MELKHPNRFGLSRYYYKIKRMLATKLYAVLKGPESARIKASLIAWVQRSIPNGIPVVHAPFWVIFEGETHNAVTGGLGHRLITHWPGRTPLQIPHKDT